MVGIGIGKERVMSKYDKPTDVLNRSQELKGLWASRNRNITGWYDTLSLVDELKQSNMESVVSNDPRTFYNTALHLLSPNVPHRIPVQGLDREAIAWTSSIEGAIKNNWSGLDRQYRRRGRKSWMEYMVGLLLITGWHSVLCMATSDALVAEVWNPYEVFPDWDSQGLASVAHIFTVGKGQAVRLFEQREWDMQDTLKGRDVTITDLWDVTNEGVINVTLAEGRIVKPETVEPFEEIPILTGPAGGLPDDGPIRSSEWRADVGQSILATNQDVYKQQNRTITFMQQILRDTAQPKYWEKSSGTDSILTPEDLEARGAIFRLGERDDVGTIPMPGIPVELISLIGSYGQMIQKGAVPDALSGQVQNIPIGLMSQVAAAAVQVLSRYHRAITGLLTDIDNIWLKGMLDGVFQSEAIIVPKEVPLDVLLFDVQFPINIPGDLIQRATVTRMIAPNTRISNNTALDLFFPEITDPIQEGAQARADDAQSSPVFMSLTLISALREEAAMLRQSGNSEDADLLDKAQEVTMQQLLGQVEQPQTNGASPAGIPPRGLSPDQQQLMQGLGVNPGGQQ